MTHRAVDGLVKGAALRFATIAALCLFTRVGTRATPEEISQTFNLDTYTHDFSSVWDRASSADPAARSKLEFLASNPMPSKLGAALLDQLAEWGDFETGAVASTGPSRAVVSAYMQFPHSGPREVEELFAEAADPEADRGALLQQLPKLREVDQLQFLEGDFSFDMLSEGNRRRIAQHWGQSVTVRLVSAVSSDLPGGFPRSSKRSPRSRESWSAQTTTSATTWGRPSRPRRSTKSVLQMRPSTSRSFSASALRSKRLSLEKSVRWFFCFESTSPLLASLPTS